MNSITRLAVARTAIPVLVYNHALAPKNARLRNATILACETSLVKLAKSPMEIVYGEIVNPPHTSFSDERYHATVRISSLQHLQEHKFQYLHVLMSKDWEYMGDHILGKVRYNKRPVLVPMDLAMGLLGGGLSNGRIGSLGVGKWARM